MRFAVYPIFIFITICFFLSPSNRLGAQTLSDSCTIKYSYRVYNLDGEYYAYDSLKQILDGQSDSLRSNVPYIVGDSTFIYIEFWQSICADPFDKVACNCDSVKVSSIRPDFGGDAFCPYMLIYGFSSKDLNGRVLAAGGGPLAQCLKTEINSANKSDTLIRQVMVRKNKTVTCFYDSAGNRVIKQVIHRDSTRIKIIETPANHKRKEVVKGGKGLKPTKYHGWIIINGKKKRYRYRHKYNPPEDVQ